MAMRRLPAALLSTIAFVASAVEAHPGGHNEDARPATHGSTHVSADEDVRISAIPAAVAHVRISETGGIRTIEADGIPDHATGQFPNRNNPNTIRPQRYIFRMPTAPKAGDRPTNVGGWLFGVALNGVPFDPDTAEFWRNDRSSGWRYDALSGKLNLGLDQNLAHVQPTGAYHYHGLPTVLASRSGANGKSQLVLLGYAADGFPIYTPYGYATADDATSPLKKLRSSYQLKKGTRPAGNAGPGGKYDGTFVQDFEYVAGSGDLDECNGRVGVTPEYPQGTFYYAVTEEFPFISRYLRGTPDPSFRHAAAGGPGGPPGRFPPPRPGFGPPPR
jgi:hypothetical protein